MVETLADITNTAPKAQVVRRAGVIFTQWEHVIDEGIDWHEALSRDYWARVVDRFRPGDMVIIHTNDHMVQFRMLVLDCNTAADPVYLHVAYQAIYPADLQLPQPQPQLPPRYVSRQAPGSSAFHVVDMETGKATHDHSVDRHRAQEMEAELNRALDFSNERMVSALARQFEAADPAPRSKAAARTAAWRERKRAEAAEATAAQGEAAA